MARRIGFPVLVRPSYGLGGRTMVIAYDEDTPMWGDRKHYGVSKVQSTAYRVTRI